MLAQIFSSGQAASTLGVDALAAGGEGAGLAAAACAISWSCDQAFVGLVVLDLEVLLEPGDDFGKDGAGDQDAGFAHGVNGTR